MTASTCIALPQSLLAATWRVCAARDRRRVYLMTLALMLGSGALHAQNVLQRGYNPGVSGANLQETVLNTGNVGPDTFGMLFTLPVDGDVYAQPLYMPRVVIGRRVHKVIYVVTMNDVVDAFDADSAGAPLWSINLADLVGAMPVPIAQFTFSGNRNIVGNLGILSTPVIDAPNHLMYVVACTLEAGTMVYRLHAIDVRNGSEPLGPGVQIAGSYGGLTFDARYVTQRVSLTLADNQVVFGFGAVELEFPGGYSGWVMSYDKATLQQSGVFATVTTGTNGGGVWQSGRPPVVGRAGDVFVFTGNGYTNGYDGVHDFSESTLKLNPAKGLTLVDWFTPGDWSSLDSQDLDLSSSGPLLIPGTQLLAGGGKNGELYILNSNNLGKFNANDSQVVQKELVSAGSLRGGPVFWQRAAQAGGSLLYVWGTHDGLKSYPFSGRTIAANPSAQGGNPSQIFPGGILTLSADGAKQGTGVLWATIATSGDANNNPPVPGALQAFDAENVANQLWSSTTNPTRDNYGNFAKFVPPLVVNGKVYVATSSGQLAVYGLLP